MIINIHRSAVKNIGDIYSSPLKYFSFEQKTKIFDICLDYKRLPLEKIKAKLKFDKLHIIVGGGGLIENDYFEKSIKYISNTKFDSLIYWGVGHNKHYDISSDKKMYDSINLFNKSNLWGVRDKLENMNYLPCVSCMHPSLQKKFKVTNDIVLYEHEHIPLNTTSLKKMPKLINNTVDFDDVISFLGSSNYIITNSFHGMYWGLLLGKKVIAIPFSNKFNLFPYKIPMGSLDEWEKLICETKDYPEALEDCRDLNNQFYKKTLDIIS